jgi:hypothetical protein
MRVPILLFALAIDGLAAGPFVFGARAGAPVIDASGLAGSAADRLGGLSSSRQFQVGPTAGVRLPFGFSVEGDALFRRETLEIGSLAGFSALNTHSDSWEFPIMFKYTGGDRTMSPVLGAGISLRHFMDSGGIPSSILGGSLLGDRSRVGFVAGGGLRMRFGPVDITPELRYTRWGSGGLVGSALGAVLPLRRNEASVLVGITF